MKLSVVIPAYNEEERLSRTLPKILNFFESRDYSSEIIIANDGSRDKTAEIVQEFIAKHPQLRLVNLKKNQGKGGALRQGVLASKGEWVLFMDADLSTPLKEIDKFWPYSKDFFVIIGSRKMSGAEIVTRQSFLRENLGKVFTFLTNTLATGNLSDVTCGFKLFHGDLARTLFKLGIINDWSFDAEILFLAQKFGHRIKEVPVEWHNDPRTKVSMLKDGVNAFKGLLRIRTNDFKGLYSS